MARLEELVDQLQHQKDANQSHPESVPNGHTDPASKGYENQPSPSTGRPPREMHYLAPSAPSSPMRRPGTGRLTSASLPRHESHQDEEAADPLASEFRRTDS